MDTVTLNAPPLNIPQWQKELAEGDTLWVIFGGVSGIFRICSSRREADDVWNSLPGYGYTIAEVHVNSLHKVPGDY